jgi:hypothetical protein
MSYYRLEMWFDANEPKAPSGRYKLHWGLAVSPSSASGPFVPEGKTVVNGKKVITIPDGTTSSIDFLVFDVTNDGVQRTVNTLTVNFTCNGSASYPFVDASQLASGYTGQGGTQTNNAAKIYCKPSLQPAWAWEWGPGMQPFTQTGDYLFTGSAQIGIPGGTAVFTFDPEMEIDSTGKP